MCVWRCITLLIVCQESVCQISRTEVLNRLLSEYSNKVPPNFDTDDSLDVAVSVYINSFDSINESSMDYSLSMFLRQAWRDPRLAFENLTSIQYLTLDSKMADMLWKPDLFFSNEKQGHFHYVTVPNNFIRIFPNGTVSYSTRLSLILSCPMRLHKFPLDTQMCTLALETYAYNTRQLIFHWHGENPVQVSPDHELSQFQLSGQKIREFTRFYSTGEFSALEAVFVLKRDLGYYMIQTYIPSAMIVVLSWVSFWLSADAVPARISLGVLTVLTMTTMSSGSLSTLPRVSYIKAMDVWMSICLLFVFAALLEFAFVNVLSRRKYKRHFRHVIQYGGVPLNANGDKIPGPLCVNCARILSDLKLRKRNFEHCSSHVPEADDTKEETPSCLDTISKYAFPLVFLLFNMTYWIGYICWREHDIKLYNRT